MSRLPHGVVVGARRDEGGGWVEGAFVEEGVDCDGEEGGEGSEEGGVGIEDGNGWWGRGRHGEGGGVVVDVVVLAKQAADCILQSSKLIFEKPCLKTRL